MVGVSVAEDKRSAQVSEGRRRQQRSRGDCNGQIWKFFLWEEGPLKIPGTKLKCERVPLPTSQILLLFWSTSLKRKTAWVPWVIRSEVTTENSSFSKKRKIGCLHSYASRNIHFWVKPLISKPKSSLFIPHSTPLRCCWVFSTRESICWSVYWQSGSSCLYWVTLLVYEQAMDSFLCGRRAHLDWDE